MNKIEREKLTDVITALEYLRDEAPSKTTYSGGRTRPSIAAQLNAIITSLQAMAGDDNGNSAENK